jgi:hypothetical protein
MWEISSFKLFKNMISRTRKIPNTSRANCAGHPASCHKSSMEHKKLWIRLRHIRELLVHDVLKRGKLSAWWWLQVHMLYVASFQVRVFNYTELPLMAFIPLVIDSRKNTYKLSLIPIKSVFRVFVIVGKPILKRKKRKTR